MKKNSLFSGITFLFAVLMLAGLSSCKKDSTNNDSDSDVIKENSASDAAYNDVDGVTEEAYTSGSISNRNAGEEKVFTGSCAVVTFDTTTTPRTMTIDFGSVDCLCHDGNYRRGKILVSWQGHYRDSGSTHTITFDKYYQNYNKIMGTRTVTNTGTDVNGYKTFSVSVNGSIDWDAQYGGGTSTYQSSRIRTWISGENTLTWWDDVYEITGTVDGVTRGGTAYHMATQTPLRVEIGFRHFTSGVLEFTPGSLPTRYIDYGYQNGARDNLAQVTIGSSVFTVVLR